LQAKISMIALWGQTREDDAIRGRVKASGKAEKGRCNGPHVITERGARIITLGDRPRVYLKEANAGRAGVEIQSNSPALEGKKA